MVYYQNQTKVCNPLGLNSLVNYVKSLYSRYLSNSHDISSWDISGIIHDDTWCIIIIDVIPQTFPDVDVSYRTRIRCIIDISHDDTCYPILLVG